VLRWTVRYKCRDHDDEFTEISYDANDRKGVLTNLNRETAYVVMVAATDQYGLGDFTEKIVSTLIDRKYIFI